MELAIAIAFVLVGFLLLMWSADLLVDNASALAQSLGVSTLLVGIVIVGFGTSAPELFVSAMAALDNKGNLALGNALGSNITNIGMVLGSAALVRALSVERHTATRDLPLVIFVGIMAVVLVSDGLLSFIDGLVLATTLVAYLSWSVMANSGTSAAVSKPSSHEIVDETTGQEATVQNAIFQEAGDSNLKTLTLTIVSIIILMGASKLLVEGAVTIAEYLGVGELIIGLTIVAIGTSLPELAAAIAAARKGVHDMILGNIIGSNVFNTLGVLGLTGLIRATEIDTTALWRDFPVMLAFTFLMLFFALTKGMIGRREGGILLGGYVAYLIYLIVQTV